jgi:hypothetical protein
VRLAQALVAALFALPAAGSPASAGRAEAEPVRLDAEAAAPATLKAGELQLTMAPVPSVLAAAAASPAIPLLPAPVSPALPASAASAVPAPAARSEGPGAMRTAEAVSAGLERPGADQRGVLEGAYGGAASAGAREPIGPLEKADPTPFGKSEASGRVQAIALYSRKGQRRLEQARDAGALDPSILENYEPQLHKAFCGVASGCIVMGALGQSDGEGGKMTQKKFLEGHEDIKPLEAVTDLGSLSAGLSLGELTRFLARHGLSVRAVYADELQDDGLARLRQTVKNVLAERDARKLIVNYHGRTIGTKTGGHFSPVAAYHEASDSVLVLDTAAHKNKPFWIPIKDLYFAMQKKDESDGSPRGYVVVDKRPAQ